jgi:hypothetical protein
VRATEYRQAENTTSARLRSLGSSRRPDETPISTAALFHHLNGAIDSNGEPKDGWLVNTEIARPRRRDRAGPIFRFDDPGVGRRPIDEVRYGRVCICPPNVVAVLFPLPTRVSLLRRTVALIPEAKTPVALLVEVEFSSVN